MTLAVMAFAVARADAQQLPATRYDGHLEPHRSMTRRTPEARTSLFAGALAHRIGAPYTVIVTGACSVAGALWFTLDLPKVHAVMRPIYEEMGVLPAGGSI